jgi:hypothetical protein
LVGQSVVGSISWSVAGSWNRLDDRSVSVLVDGVSDASLGRTFSASVGWLVGWSMGRVVFFWFGGSVTWRNAASVGRWLFGWSVDWSFGRVVGSSCCLFGEMVGSFVCSFVGLCIGWLVHWVGLSVRQSGSQLFGGWVGRMVV